MPPPVVPNEHYLWLGRVASAYGMVDVQIGMVGWAARTGEAWTEDWTEVAGAPGAAVRLCEQALAVLPADLAERVRGLLEDARCYRQERHRLAHAVLILDPEVDVASAPWVLRDPKGAEIPLLDEARGAELVAALNGLSRRAVQLRKDIVSWRQRTVAG